MSHITKECAKFQEKMTLGSKNDMRNLVNFNVWRGKSERFYLYVLLFSIAYKVSAEKEQELSLTTLEKYPNFLFEKWHKKFGEI